MAGIGEAPTPEGLRASLQDLIAESRALRTDVRADAAQRRRESLITIGIGVLLMVFVLTVGLIAWQNQQIGKQNATISHQIADCTTAGGECYQRGAERTSAAINELVRANMAVHECIEEFEARDVTVTHEALSDCVAKKTAPPK